MELPSEHCGRCKALVYAFSSKKAVSNRSIYCMRCAEELDKEYLARNICSVCTCLMARGELKFVMPSRLYSSYFFDKLPIHNRLMCVDCYKKAKKLDILRKPMVNLGIIRTKLSRSIIKKAKNPNTYH